MKTANEFLHVFEGLLTLHVVVEEILKCKTVSFMTKNDYLLFSLEPGKVFLFRKMLEAALKREFRKNVKALNNVKATSSKIEIANALLPSITLWRKRSLPVIEVRIEGEGADHLKGDSFDSLITLNTNHSPAEIFQICENLAKEVYQEQLKEVRTKIEKLLADLSNPANINVPDVVYENRFKLAYPGVEEKVRRFFSALKIAGYISGGNENAFVNIFKGFTVGKSIVFDFRFQKKVDVRRFLQGLIELQSSIIFPKKGRGKRSFHYIDWQFLSQHFTYMGEAFDVTIKKNVKGKLPKDLQEIIKYLA